jgi:hypothetical protein
MEREWLLLHTAEDITDTKLSCVWERLSSHGAMVFDCTAAAHLQPPSSVPWSLIVY